MGTPGVGQDIEGLCGRCGQTWHVVMAKVGEQIAKVVCKRCGGHHSYRSAATEAASGTGDGGAAAADPKRALGRGRMMRPRSRSRRYNDTPPPVPPPFDPSKPPRTYGAKEAFATGERVTHGSFGTGVVSGSPGPGKIEIAFPTGARVLACAKVASTLERPTAAANVPVADRPPK